MRRGTHSWTGSQRGPASSSDSECGGGRWDGARSAACSSSTVRPWTGSYSLYIASCAVIHRKHKLGELRVFVPRVLAMQRKALCQLQYVRAPRRGAGRSVAASCPWPVLASGREPRARTRWYAGARLGERCDVPRISRASLCPSSCTVASSACTRRISSARSSRSRRRVRVPWPWLVPPAPTRAPSSDAWSCCMVSNELSALR